MTLGLLCLVGVSAWADNTVTVTTGGSSTEYATLKAAIEASVLANATADMTITISDNQSLGEKVVSWEKAFTLTIKATKDITIKGPNGSRWFTVKNAGANLIVGDGNYEITLDGEYNGTAGSKERTQPVALRNNTTASITFNKVTFANFNLNNAVNMIVAENGGGSITLQDVTINNCVNPKNGYIDNQRVENDKVLLKGYLNIDEASNGTAFYLALETKTTGSNGRIKIMDDNFTASKPLSIEYHETSSSYTPTIGASLVIKDNSLNNFTDAQTKMFTLTDSEKGLVKNNKDLKLTQAYTLDVNSYGAATLVLPFESTIPTGVSAYKVSYTSGENSVTATEVTGGTLPAATPVLINAAEGKHKFVSTATSGDAATGSGTVTVGALVGNYDESLTVSSGYVLYADATHTVGFYKAGTGVTIGANRAYLKSDGGSLARLAIVFDDEATAINAVEAARADSNQYYNLQGVRVDRPTRGIYVKNGKKIVIK